MRMMRKVMRMFFLWFGVDEICNDLLHLFQISFYSLWDLKVSTNWSKLFQIYQFLPAWYLGIGLVKLCTLTTLSVQEKQTATTQATFQIKTQTLYHCAMCKTRRNLDIFFKVFCRSSCVYMHPALGITVCFLLFFCFFALFCGSITVPPIGPAELLQCFLHPIIWTLVFSRKAPLFVSVWKKLV